jgi:hypothetical protein
MENMLLNRPCAVSVLIVSGLPVLTSQIISLFAGIRYYLHSKERAVAQSFVSSFRLVSLIWAVLALANALSA